MTNNTSYERYNDIISIAAMHAEKSPLKWKYACIIMNKNKIVSIGYNHYRLTQVSGLYSTHAEIDALLKCRDKRQLNGADMYVVRINVNKELPYVYLKAVPCEECEKKIKKCMKEYGLKKCYYTTKISKDNSIYGSIRSV